MDNQPMPPQYPEPAHKSLLKHPVILILFVLGLILIVSALAFGLKFRKGLTDSEREAAIKAATAPTDQSQLSPDEQKNAYQAATAPVGGKPTITEIDKARALELATPPRQ